MPTARQETFGPQSRRLCPSHPSGIRNDSPSQRDDRPDHPSTAASVGAAGGAAYSTGSPGDLLGRPTREEREKPVPVWPPSGRAVGARSFFRRQQHAWRGVRRRKKCRRSHLSWRSEVCDCLAAGLCLCLARAACEMAWSQMPQYPALRAVAPPSPLSCSAPSRARACRVRDRVRPASGYPNTPNPKPRVVLLLPLSLSLGVTQCCVL